MTDKQPGELPHVEYAILSPTGKETIQVSIRPCRFSEICKAVELINWTHPGYDLFSQLSPASLLARMSRSQSYTPANYFILENGNEIVAVSGLWYMGNEFKEIRRDKQTQISSEIKRAAVVDLGYQSGASYEMSLLLQRIVGLAAETGFHQVMFAEEEPVVTALLTGLVEQEYEVMLLYSRALALLYSRALADDVPLPEPPVYLDPIYF